MTRLLKYLKPYSWQLVALCLLIFGQTIANLTLPDYMANIVNKGVVGQDLAAIYSYGLLMVLVTIAGGICAIGVGYFSARIGAGFARELRDRIFEKIESFSLVEFNRFSTSSLITRSTNDIQQIQTVLVLLLRLALMAPFMGVMAVFKAYNTAASMTWIMAVSVGALVAIIAIIFAIALPRFTKVQKLVDKLSLVTREILTGLRVIRAFDKETYEEAKFNRTNQELTDVNLFVNRLMVILQPAMMLIMNVTMVAIVWVGAHQIDMGKIQIGDMLAFMQYAMQAIMAFLMISIIFIMVPRASISAERVADVLDSESSVKDPTKPAQVPKLGGRVEFKNVSFAYQGAEEPVLQDISFIAVPGETTAIVGSTGSGKSTLINLIPRFYDATAGQLLVDGVDVRDMTQADLRERIGYVSQRAMLFSGTVRENITYGRPDATVGDVEYAAGIAQATDFVNNLSEKFESPIAQAGANVSGGQKQRLAIARAIAKKPEIYIFDDSFSALDFKTDAALRHALASETKGKTVLIVAQRISTIMNAEKIVVLDAGKVVAQGTHRDLMQSSPVYREIASSQLSEKELAGVK
jgi:ATP-binding cassette subfamily B protein